MDLSKFVTDTAVAARMEILDPIKKQPILGEDGKPIFWEVLSSDSDKYKSFIRKQQNRRLSTPGRAKITAEELEGQQNEGLVQVVVGGSVIKVNGKSYDPKNPDDVRQALNLLPWLKEQVSDFFEDRGNFLTA